MLNLGVCSKYCSTAADLHVPWALICTNGTPDRKLCVAPPLRILCGVNPSPDNPTAAATLLNIALSLGAVTTRPEGDAVVNNNGVLAVQGTRGSLSTYSSHVARGHTGETDSAGRGTGVEPLTDCKVLVHLSLMITPSFDASTSSQDVCLDGSNSPAVGGAKFDKRKKTKKPKY